MLYRTVRNKLNNKCTQDPLTPKAQLIKGKTDEAYFLQFPVKRMKRQATDLGNIFANHLSTKD